MIINIRVSKLELIYIREQKVLFCLPVAAFLRILLFQRALPNLTPPLNLEAHHQLSPVKSNLTQIKNAVCQGGIIPFDLAPLEALAAKTEILRLTLRHPLPDKREKPAPPDKAPRTHRIRIRLTPAEAKDLRFRARLQDISVSALIRNLALKFHSPSRFAAISIATFKALYRRQWRLNAIAHAINGKRLRSFDRRILVKLDQSYRAVFRELGLPMEDT